MPNRTRPYREALLEALADPVEAAHYLSTAIGDSPDMFLKALRNVAQARQMSKVAKAAGVTRESLYRATSLTGNPTLDTLASVLNALGLQIKIEALSLSSVRALARKPSMRSRGGVIAANRSSAQD